MKTKIDVTTVVSTGSSYRLGKREKAESISKNTPISTFSRVEIEKQYLNLQKEKRTIAKSEKKTSSKDREDGRAGINSFG